MAFFTHKVGRKQIWFTDHALDRYWQRHMDKDPHAGRKESREALVHELDEARLTRSIPNWANMNRWQAARCRDVLVLDDERLFVVVQNPGGDLVAVTFLTKELIHA